MRGPDWSFGNYSFVGKQDHHPLCAPNARAKGLSEQEWQSHQPEQVDVMPSELAA